MENNLLEGKITKTLTKLTIPIVASSFLMMAYNLVDIFFIGKLGSNAVAAVGVSSMFAWLYSGISLIPRIGGQVKIGHSLGAGNKKDATDYASSTLQISIILAVIYGLGCFLFARPIISLFNLNNSKTINDAIIYLQITSGLCIFSFLNAIFTGIFTATGDSKTPLKANGIGVISNIILDPIMILGLGPCPKLGVLGAALATLIATIVAFSFFIYEIKKKKTIILDTKLNKKYESYHYKDIVKIGFPIGVQSMLFSLCSMIIASFVAGFGDGAVAAQKVGSQVESISWAMAEGFEAAINSFIAQNYGAKNYERVDKGYKTIIGFGVIWGLITTILLLVFPHQIFSLFLDDPTSLAIGVDYLRIIAISQLFMIIEVTTSGAFSGLGFSLPPSIVGVVFTLGRVPTIMICLALGLNLNAIFWVISISSIFKGTVLCSWFVYYKKHKLLKGDNHE
ncbi:MAG: MATE family efflux transporter [Thomasclavelia sp.]|jgi:putative MATE family efflux protein|nr:MATE family efflux transporter [Thomasclavelia sp.]